jgi:hypothetical protein
MWVAIVWLWSPSFQITDAGWPASSPVVPGRLGHLTTFARRTRRAGFPPLPHRHCGSPEGDKAAPPAKGVCHLSTPQSSPSVASAIARGRQSFPSLPRAWDSFKGICCLEALSCTHQTWQTDFADSPMGDNLILISKRREGERGIPFWRLIACSSSPLPCDIRNIDRHHMHVVRESGNLPRVSAVERWAGGAVYQFSPADARGSSHTFPGGTRGC